jgi:hypothetical protein
MHTVHNARIQTLATALNNLGVGSILTGIVAPVVHNEIKSGLTVAGWLVGGVACVGAAQWLLGRLR